MAENGAIRHLVPLPTPPDQRPATRRSGFDLSDPISERFWPAIAAGVLMLVVGLTAYFTNQPFLYPSLGPTAILQAEFPFHRSSRFRDTTIGHMIGVAAGLASVLVLGASSEPRLGTGSHTPPLRIGAAALYYDAGNHARGRVQGLESAVGEHRAIVRAWILPTTGARRGGGAGWSAVPGRIRRAHPPLSLTLTDKVGEYRPGHSPRTASQSSIMTIDSQTQSVASRPVRSNPRSCSAKSESIFSASSGSTERARSR